LIGTDEAAVQRVQTRQRALEASRERAPVRAAQRWSSSLPNNSSNRTPGIVSPTSLTLQPVKRSMDEARQLGGEGTVSTFLGASEGSTLATVGAAAVGTVSTLPIGISVVIRQTRRFVSEPFLSVTSVSRDG
jgi:hypothetical protein